MLPTAHDPDASIRGLRSLNALIFGDCFGASGGYVSRSGERVLRPSPWFYTDDSVLACGLLAELLNSGDLTPFSAAHAMAVAYRENKNRGFSPATVGCFEAFLRGHHSETAAARLFGGLGSRGNGAAMRVAPVGAALPHDRDLTMSYARLTALPTHTHDEAIDGAVVVAVLANKLAHAGVDIDIFAHLTDLTTSISMTAAIRESERLAGCCDLEKAVAILGNGSGCLALDTVPLCVWIVHQCREDIGRAYWMAVGADGDRDTCAAIVGGIIGAAITYTTSELLMQVGVNEEQVDLCWLEMPPMA